MTGTLDRIEQLARAASQGQRGKLKGYQRVYDFAPSGGYWMELDPADVLALVEVAKAAQEVSRIEATGVLPDFMPLAVALARLEDNQ